jgi:hypothetical protein
MVQYLVVLGIEAHDQRGSQWLWVSSVGGQKVQIARKSMQLTFFRRPGFFVGGAIAFTGTDSGMSRRSLSLDFFEGSRILLLTASSCAVKPPSPKLLRPERLGSSDRKNKWMELTTEICYLESVQHDHYLHGRGFGAPILPPSQRLLEYL